MVFHFTLLQLHLGIQKMSEPFFQVDPLELKRLTLRMKEYLDHNENIDPRLYMIFASAIEHTLFAYIYGKRLNAHLSGKDDLIELQLKLNAELEELENVMCPICENLNEN